MLKDQIIVGKDAIVAAMVAVNIDGKKWQEQVQVVIVSACLHIHEHGDYRILRNLLRDFPKGGKSTALVAYLLQFAPVTIEVKGQDMAIEYDKEARMPPSILQSGDDAAIEAYKQFLTDMMNTSWSEFKPAKKVNKLDVPKKIEALIKSINEHNTTPVDGDVIPNHALELLQLHNGTRINFQLLLKLAPKEMLEQALFDRNCAVKVVGNNVEEITLEKVG